MNKLEFDPLLESKSTTPIALPKPILPAEKSLYALTDSALEKAIGELTDEVIRVIKNPKNRTPWANTCQHYIPICSPVGPATARFDRCLF